MNTISVLLLAIQKLINALLPAISAVEHIAASADLYANTIHNEAKIVNAQSTKEFYDALEEAGLDSELQPLPKDK